MAAFDPQRPSPWARVEMAKGSDVEAKALAQEIIAAQHREIGVTDAWLAVNGG